jgi:methylated-DNA-[protein]-cysteine S-methyltransferase
MNDFLDLEAMLRPDAGAEERSAELARLLAEDAARSGEAEVAYATVDTPVGTTLIAQTDRGVVSVGLPNRSLDEWAGGLANRISPRVVEAPAALDEARRELDEYFTGRRRKFELPLDQRLMPGGFYGKVLATLPRLGYGEVITYGDLAAAAGNARAHRAAGTAVGINPLPIVVPCHRVVRAGGGDPGNYGGGPELKKWLLALEGAA